MQKINGVEKQKKMKIKYILLVFIIIILLLILMSVILSEEKLQIVNNNIENNVVENNINNIPNTVENINVTNKTKVDVNNIVIVEDNTTNNTIENTEYNSVSEENLIENNIVANNSIDNNTTYPSASEEVITDIYTILSESKEWQEIQTINIFKNVYYTNAVIAPGVEGSYKFDVNNGLVVPMQYTIQFEEMNNKDINMKYKLKFGDTYIVDEWTDIENIVLPVFQISSLIRARYKIEWKWIDSPNDTQVGLEAEEALYNLKILVTSTEL